MKVNRDRTFHAACVYGVTPYQTFVDALANQDDRHLEHLCHEVAHALLLPIRSHLYSAEPTCLSSLIEDELRSTRHRRKYRDEAHVLVATSRLLKPLCEGATQKIFENVSRGQRVRRREWRAALASPRARVLERDLRALLVRWGVLVLEVSDG
jgi:hypothetical protein